MGGNIVILVWTKRHHIDGLHVKRLRGAVSLAKMLSPVRYIQPLVNLRKIMKLRVTKDQLQYVLYLHFFNWSFLGGAWLTGHCIAHVDLRLVCGFSVPNEHFFASRDCLDNGSECCNLE